MDTFKVICSGLLCGLLLPTAAAAQSTVYTWVDSDGQVRYSDEAPPGGKARQMTIEPSPIRPPVVPPAALPTIEPVQAPASVQATVEPIAAAIEPTAQTVNENSTLFLWTGADGTTHYGADPPEGVAARPVSLPPLQSAASEKPKPQVFIWRDASGQAHYGSEPPEDVLAEPVDLDSRSMTTVGGGGLRPSEQSELDVLGTPPAVGQ